jgi:DNA polymerase I-like protein with 3'-5' exonuclease and polymerase domains
MVMLGELVLIDLTFLLRSSEQSFYGAPLLLGPQGEDYTVLFGVVAALFRLRTSVGIHNGIVIIGSEACAVSTEANVSRVVRFLNRLHTPVIYDPNVRTTTLCRCFAPSARWLVTQNKACFQFVSDAFGVIVPDIAGGESEIVSVESLRASLGVRPPQVPSFLALTDGGKNALFTKRQAIRLLEIHDDLKAVFQDVAVVSSNQIRRQLSANEKVLMGRLRDMMLEEEICPPIPPAVSELAFIRDDQNSADILREYGFWSLVRMLPKLVSSGVPASAKVKREVAYKAIRNEAEMRELQLLVSKSEVCAVDTEASDKDSRSASLFGVALSVKAGEAFYVPLTEADLEGMSPEATKAYLRRIFAGQTGFIGHNLKFDCVLLRRHGIAIRNQLFDTMLAAYECFGDWEFFNLGSLSKKLLGKDIKRYRDIVGKGETWLDVPFNELRDHACADADITLRLYHRLQRELTDRRLSEQFSSDTMALLTALADKEYSGVRLHIRAVHRRREALAEEAEGLKKAVTTAVGRDIDLDSPAATTNVLREIIPIGEQAGRHLTLTRLEQLAGTHSLPRLIVKYSRTQQVIRQLEAICKSAKNGKVFPIFSQVKWAHGTLSSTDPRICGPGGPLEATTVMDKIICERMDDPNRSLDILQRVTGDGVLKRNCRGSLDHLCSSGKNAAGRDLDQKDLLLSVVIGLSDAALSKRFLIDRLTAAGIRETVGAKYVKVFKWLDTYRRDAMALGFAYHDGKRKYLEGLKSSDIDRRNQAVVSAVRWAIRY